MWTIKDLHVFSTDASVRQSLEVASEVAQVHDMETKVFDTCCDDVFDLVQSRLRVLAGELALVYTYIEAPNAKPGNRSIRPEADSSGEALLELDIVGIAVEPLGARRSNKGLGLSFYIHIRCI